MKTMSRKNHTQPTFGYIWYTTHVDDSRDSTSLHEILHVISLKAKASLCSSSSLVALPSDVAGGVGILATWSCGFTNSQGFERQVRLSNRSSHSMNQFATINHYILKIGKILSLLMKAAEAVLLQKECEYFSTRFVQGSLLLDIASTTKTISNSEAISQNCHGGFFKN